MSAIAEKAYTYRMAEGSKTTEIEEHHPDFATEIRTFINDSLPIHNKKEHRKFIQGVTGIISRHRKELTIPTPRHDEEMRLAPDDELNLLPKWGAVVPQIVDKPKQKREKFLVIHQGVRPSLTLGPDAPEYHVLKDEYLTIREGYVLMLVSEPNEWEDGQVTLTFAGPGDKFAFHPGNRHTIIGITNALVVENSNNTLKSDIYSAYTN